MFSVEIEDCLVAVHMIIEDSEALVLRKEKA